MSNKLILLIFVTLLCLSGGVFYWYGYRPSRIKHDCSWMRIIEPAVPARPSMTESELKDVGILKNCDNTSDWLDETLGKESTHRDPVFENQRQSALTKLCIKTNNEIIDEYSVAKEAVTAKESWRKASENEYKFCLRDKGL